MRPALKVRKPRPVHVIVGALMLAIPTSAVALSAGSADAQSALQMTLNHQYISYGQSLIATGIAPRSEGGRKLTLELAPAGRPWRAIGSAIVHSNGHYRIVASPRQSGSVRVLVDTGASAARASGGAGSGGASPSPARAIAVRAALRAPLRSISGLSGQAVDIRGTLLPQVAGRVVMLEGGSGHGWRTLAKARTHRNGRFDLRYSAGGAGQLVVRVHFAGDRLNGATATRASALTFYRQSLASWYDDGGATACGFHATYGVANKDLPCGTNVTFSYGGHTITATVDDRGPYVGGREWDLNQNTAGALGFSGVDTVWSSR